MLVACTLALLSSYLISPRPPPSVVRRTTIHHMAADDDKSPGLGAPSFEAFKQMMERDVSPEKLSVSEQVSKGVSKSWVNPAYWSRQFVTAQHIANNVPNNSKVLELGKDAKNLYYLNSPGACTLIVPPSNYEIKEGPIREAAVKLDVPFTLWTNKALDTIPLTQQSFDAALCFDMLDAAPEQAVQGALSLLGNALKPGGRLIFLERNSVGLPAAAREFGFGVEYEEEGGYDVGILTRRNVGKPASKRGEQSR